MADNLKSYLTRPKRYENIDGTVDIFFGAMYLGFALQVYAASRLPKGTSWGYSVATFLFVYVAGFLGWWAGKIIKKRITFPRTGYVAYQRPATTLTAVFWGAIVVAAAVAWVIIRLTKGQDLASLARPGALASLVLPYVLFLVLGREHVWKWLVALVMVLGVSVIGLLAPGSATELFQPAACFAGLVWIASGLITLYLYIRRTQPPPAEPE